ncbi:MAG: wax ester/triacylglycerol synthase family O-acyltransferase [Sandaracinus sp.]|nr:wax ester/triacylglycerol synthase family O-acyltransferase [Sandaracinus sp.]
MQQLSGLDAAFLYLETPQMHMHVALCAVLDPKDTPGGYRFEALEEHLRARLQQMPPFRKKILEDPLGLDHPHWVDDPDFDLIHHLRRVTCPAPGGRRELGAIVGRITSRPLPRDRPLWEIWVVEGLKHGRIALVAKIHHCAVDGMMGAGLLASLFHIDRGRSMEKPSRRVESLPPPADGEMLRHAARQRLAQPRKLFDLAKRTAKAVGAVVEQRLDPENEAKGGTPFTAPRTHFNHAIGPQRDVGLGRLSLAELKRVRHAVEGAKLNDVLLAVIAGALRRYLQSMEDLPAEPLVATCPIATMKGSGNNKVSAMFVPLPTQLDDPRERLAQIMRATRGAKAEHETLGGVLIQEWAQLAPTSTFSFASNLYTRLRLAERHRPIHSLVISNVPGPPVPIYLAGMELLAAYPMGPVMDGAGLNVTVMSYRGDVDFGLMVARDAVPDPWRLALEMKPALDELIAAVADPVEPVEPSPTIEH